MSSEGIRQLIKAGVTLPFPPRECGAVPPIVVLLPILERILFLPGQFLKQRRVDAVKALQRLKKGVTKLNNRERELKETFAPSPKPE